MYSLPPAPYTFDLPVERVADEHGWRIAATGRSVVPGQEITRWFEQQGIFMDYERLGGDGEPQNPYDDGDAYKTTRAFRFHFDDAREAMVFKLAWGGDA